MLSVLLIGTMLVLCIRAGLKAKHFLTLAGTAYMLVHAIMQPESNSKLFAFIGLVFLFQNIRKRKDEKKA